MGSVQDYCISLFHEIVLPAIFDLRHLGYR